MYIEIEFENTPPTVTLCDADDFTSLDVRIGKRTHTAIAVEDLRRLAGKRAEAPGWRRSFDEMLAYADEKGWVTPDGRVRAHIEWSDPAPGETPRDQRPDVS